MGINVVISGSGVYLPEDNLSNQELVQSYNSFIDKAQSAGESSEASGERTATYVTEQFIYKASGIQNRRVIDKQGILDVDRMKPRISRRHESELSLQAEMAVHAARAALCNAKVRAQDLDLVIVASTSLERAYPAIAIEVQNSLGAGGCAFDMSVACSSATFAIQVAANAITAGNASRALVVTPELATAQVNFRDKQSHFIFGDGSAALILEAEEICTNDRAFRILGAELKTRFSNAIRNDFGFLNRCTEYNLDDDAAFTFRQNGIKVIRDVVPLASKHVTDHLTKLAISPREISRVWLHQANANLNRLVYHRVFHELPQEHRAPNILKDYGNLGSAGSIVAFSQFHDDLDKGSLGIICSFGAGYSVGSIVVKRN
jgi:beta-ketodecanoyl-[acyl-carrier-protein] synthase